MTALHDRGAWLAHVRGCGCPEAGELCRDGMRLVRAVEESMSHGESLPVRLAVLAHPWAWAEVAPAVAT